ncbi:MAG: hypothetical protein ACI396_06100 [Acutalibacteraceae bacterium]
MKHLCLTLAICIFASIILSSCSTTSSAESIDEIYGIIYNANDSEKKAYYDKLESAKVVDDFLVTEINDNEICINRYVGSSTTVEIPEKINNKDVTTIGIYLQVWADDSYFANGALYSDFIEKIKIPSTVKYIYFGNFLAKYCPDPEVYEDKDVALKYIEVDENNPYYSSCDGILYDKAKSRVLYMPFSYENSEVEIPKGVEIIDYNVPKNLKTVKGYKGTAAEIFAKENELEFIALG